MPSGGSALYSWQLDFSFFPMVVFFFCFVPGSLTFRPVAPRFSFVPSIYKCLIVSDGHHTFQRGLYLDLERLYIFL